MTSITWSLRDYKTVKTGFLEWLMIQGVINSQNLREYIMRL